MECHNPENLPIVGEENSYESLKQETIQEGIEADSTDECPYEMDSQFWNWWMRGFYSIESIIVS